MEIPRDQKRAMLGGVLVAVVAFAALAWFISRPNKEEDARKIRQEALRFLDLGSQEQTREIIHNARLNATRKVVYSVGVKADLKDDKIYKVGEAIMQSSGAICMNYGTRGDEPFREYGKVLITPSLSVYVSNAGDKDAMAAAWKQFCEGQSEKGIDVAIDVGWFQSSHGFWVEAKSR